MEIFYIHWNKEELERKIKPLIENGYNVKGFWKFEDIPKFNVEVPDILVISLERLPSHGREYAKAFYSSKKRQNIPIIFVGGKTDKIEAIKKSIPSAFYCDYNELLFLIKKISSN